MKLPPPYIHFLNAASGWAELGLADEARKEFDRIPMEMTVHPSALEVNWQIHAVSRNWKAALAIAEDHVRRFPDLPTGWINQSYALHEMKLTQEAWNRLVQALKRFPEISIIPYNLACYACRLGRYNESQSLLAKAVEAGDAEEIRKMALKDPDLKPLWGTFKEDPD